MSVTPEPALPEPGTLKLLSRALADQLHSSPTSSSTATAPCTPQRLRVLLQALREPLEKRQLRARKLHEALQQEATGLVMPELPALEAAIQRLNFKAALELVEKLLAELPD